MRKASVSLSIVFLIAFLLFSSTLQFDFAPNVSKVYATTYLSDTFESWKNGWTTGNDSANRIDQASEVAHGGSYSVYVNTTAVAQYGYAYKACAVTAMLYHVGVWVYVSSSVAASNQPICGFWSGAAYAFTTYINKSGSTFYVTNMLSNTPTWEQVCAITADTWNVIDVYVNRTLGKTHYYLNGAKQGGDWALSSNVSSTTCYLGDANAVYYRGKIFIDDLSVDDASEPAAQVNTVTLNSPDSASTTYTSAVTFAYTPTFYQAIQNSCLWMNVTGTWSTDVLWGNASVIVNNTQNTIAYTFLASAVIIWNIQVFNSTGSMFAAANFTLTVTDNASPTYSTLMADGTPIYDPTLETRFMTANSVTLDTHFYNLSTTQTATEQTGSVYKWGNVTSSGANISIRVWQKLVDDTETEITSTYSAVFNRASQTGIGRFAGTATWNATQTAFAVTDRILVRVYGNFGTDAFAQFTDGLYLSQFVTEPLGAAQLNNVNWTVTYYYYFSYISPNTVLKFYFGQISPDVDNSTVENFGFSLTGQIPKVAGSSCLFSALWNDNFNVSQGIFSTDNTGTWANTTITLSWSNATAAWLNTTITLNSTIGVLVQFIFYANDTSGNMNKTGTYTIITTESSGQSLTFTCNEQVIITVTQSINKALTIQVGDTIVTVASAQCSSAKAFTAFNLIQILELRSMGKALLFNVGDSLSILVFSQLAKSLEFSVGVDLTIQSVLLGFAPSVASGLLFVVAVGLVFTILGGVIVSQWRRNTRRRLE